MSGFCTLTARAVAFIQDNIDTDQLLPKQFLNAIDRVGFGKHLFHDLRYLDDHESVLNSAFVLNHPIHQGAEILISGANFGCGSSREHAPWALADYGFKVIIAESFADIFYANCVNNQLLLISLTQAQIHQIATIINTQPETMLQVDLANQQLAIGNNTLTFDIDLKIKRNLLQGLDRIGLTLNFLENIHAYEQQQPYFMRVGSFNI